MKRFVGKLASRAGGFMAREESGSRAELRFPTFEEIRPLFELELRRARRYERPLGLLILGFGPADDEARRPHRLARLGSLLHEGLRETDLVCYLADHGEFAALLPEADAATAAKGYRRIRELWSAGNASSLSGGAATYPLDGLTLDDLLARARRSLSDGEASLNGRRLQTAHAVDE